MECNRRILDSVSLAIGAVTLGCLIALSPVPTMAEDDAPKAEATSVGPSLDMPRLDLEVGYFTSRREMFRDLYESFLCYAVSYQRPVSDRFAVGLRVEFIRLAHYRPEPRNSRNHKYLSLSIAPMLIRSSSHDRMLKPTAGVGIGLGYRKVIVSGPTGGPWYYELPGYQATQTSLSIFGVAMLGLDLRLSSHAMFGVRTYFDYYPFGDPTMGDFGDTGGFHLMGRIGFRL